jgi:predicted RNase H-like HicB family nuclease
MTKNKHKYEIIIYWSEEDSSYIAEVPELAGCMADGQTYSETVSNVETIIDEWIETAKALGRVIPKPKGKLSYS